MVSFWQKYEKIALKLDIVATPGGEKAVPVKAAIQNAE